MNKNYYHNKENNKNQKNILNQIIMKKMKNKLMEFR